MDILKKLLKNRVLLIIIAVVVIIIVIAIALFNQNSEPKSEIGEGTIRQPLTQYPNKQVNIPDDVKDEYDATIRYNVYSIEKKDRISEIRSFINLINKQGLIYSADSGGNYSWVSEVGVENFEFIQYDSNLQSLALSLRTYPRLNLINANLIANRKFDELFNAFAKEYLKVDYKYSNFKTVEAGDAYMITANRIIDGLNVYNNSSVEYTEYLLVSKNNEHAIAKPVLQFTMIAAFGLIAMVCFLCQYMTSPVFTFQNSRTIVPEAGVEDISAVPDGPATGLPGNFPEVPVPPSDNNSTCPINQGAYCAQGPNGSFSHARMGTLASDVSSGAGIWRAPADGTVTESIPDMDCEWEANPIFRRGGQVKFVDGNGIEYKILHIDPYVGTGPVAKGTNIGVQSGRIVSCLGVWVDGRCVGDLNSCWSGAHYHLEVRRSGGVFNSLQWYNKTDGLNCQIRGC